MPISQFIPDSVDKDEAKTIFIWMEAWYTSVKVKWMLHNRKPNIHLRSGMTVIMIKALVWNFLQCMPDYCHTEQMSNHYIWKKTITGIQNSLRKQNSKIKSWQNGLVNTYVSKTARLFKTSLSILFFH